MTGKDNLLAFPGRPAIEAEAVAWVARFDAGDVSAKDQAAFQEWLNRSALHRQVIAEFGSLWAEFDALKLPLESAEARRKTGLRDYHPGLPKRTISWVAACAAAMIAVAGGAALFQTPAPNPAKAVTRPAAQLSQPSPPSQLSYETVVGGQKRIVLADGTSVILNTNSRMDVNFSGNRREVHLVRGEAYFEVVHDKTRPFTVYANNYVVRDIGTAFDVHLSKAGLVEVDVTKGSVEFTPAAGAAASGIVNVITAGHDLVLSQDEERAEIKSTADMGRKLAWLQGKLIYSGQPLGEVLADISRYSNIKVELADATLENLPVGGAFTIDQTDAIFSALEKNFGLHAEWVDPQHVRFTSEREETPSAMKTPQRSDHNDSSGY
jgi:transmembrane sensor